MRKPARAVIYTRISLDRTGEGVALERQQEACEHLARAREWDVVAVESDTQSAFKSKDRTGWNRVLALVAAGEVDYIIAYQMDRVARSVESLIDLSKLAKDRGVAVVTSQGDLDLSNESGRMMATILTSVAEFEVERKSTRQRAANADRAAKGHFWSGGWRTFGFELDGSHRTEEAEAIRRAVDDVLDGTSLKEIARRWEQQGLRSGRADSGRAPHGGEEVSPEWRLQSVRVVLLNPKNAALRAYHGEIVGEGVWEPIISREKFDAIRAYLTNPNRRVGGNLGGKTASNLLSGIAVCVKCEQPVRAGSSRGNPVYTCARGCVGTAREPLDEFVVEEVATRLALTPLADEWLDIDTSILSDELAAELAEVETEIAELTDALEVGDMTLEQFRPVNRRALDRREEIKALADNADVFTQRSRKAATFREQDVSGKREVLRGIEITIYPKGRGRRNVPVAEQVEIAATTANGKRLLIHDRTLALHGDEDHE